jgi:transposase
MSEKLNTTVAVIGIDIGKNSFHVVGLDARGDKSGRAARWKRGWPTCRHA